ncbi:MAG: hypothetical protein A3G75_04910 [Verrucomicrobia bacterium RIFCSPLOWO2_12_FULL_64_8]|nr:MAG: hypothetical protein A3G75_04910 [Verrucomicrobia bacterium RIFCSPLOWO2_12_FULL_64_8]
MGNVAVFHTGIAAGILVLPTALICGQIRGIPFYWRLIDCSFGVFGILPLWLAVRLIKQLARVKAGPV